MFLLNSGTELNATSVSDILSPRREQCCGQGFGVKDYWVKRSVYGKGYMHLQYIGQVVMMWKICLASAIE